MINLLNNERAVFKVRYPPKNDLQTCSLQHEPSRHRVYSYADKVCQAITEVLKQ